MPVCTGRGGAHGDHCCYIEGEVCPYYRPGRLDEQRRHVCRIRDRNNSWAETVADPAYRRNVAPRWVALGLPADYCMTWQPETNVCCAEVRP